jgi:hypothetical protein
MSRLLPLAAALLCVALASLVACNNDTSPAKEIIGTWGLDTDALSAATPDRILTEEQRKAKQLDVTLLPIVAQMRLVLTADEVVTTTPYGKTETSTYQVEKIEGDAVTIVWTKDVKAQSPIRMSLTVAGDRATLVTSANPGKPTPMKRFAAVVAPATPAPAPAQP